MTFELTNKERALLGIILRKCKTKDDEVAVDYLTTHYKDDLKYHKFHKRTDKSIRNNVKQRLRMLIMKAAALGVRLERKSARGRGHVATYGFATSGAIAKAASLLESYKEEAA